MNDATVLILCAQTGHTMSAYGFTPHAHRKKSMDPVFFESWYEFQGSRA